MKTRFSIRIDKNVLEQHLSDLLSRYYEYALKNQAMFVCEIKEGVEVFDKCISSKVLSQEKEDMDWSLKIDNSDNKFYLVSHVNFRIQNFKSFNKEDLRSFIQELNDFCSCNNFDISEDNELLLLSRKNPIHILFKSNDHNGDEVPLDNNDSLHCELVCRYNEGYNIYPLYIMQSVMSQIKNISQSYYGYDWACRVLCPVLTEGCCNGK